MRENELKTRLAFIKTVAFCAEIINSPPFDLERICEGDCEFCRNYWSNKAREETSGSKLAESERIRREG